MYQRVITLDSTNVAIPLFSSNFQALVLDVCASTTNTDKIYIGDSSVDSSTKLGQPLGPVEKISFRAPIQYGTTEMLDAHKFYVVGSANDKVIISWVAYQEYVPETGSLLLENGIDNLLTEDNQVLGF